MYAEVSAEPLTVLGRREDAVILHGRSSETSFFIVNCKLDTSFIISYAATDYRKNTE